MKEIGIARVLELGTRVPDLEVAERIAGSVVAERLAACAHVRGSIDSWYWWQGSVETSQEWEVDAITTVAVRDRCIARVCGMHPYQLPAVLSSELDASAEYAAWVRANSC